MSHQLLTISSLPQYYEIFVYKKDMFENNYMDLIKAKITELTG